MSDLDTMRAERDRLDRQIRQAETDAAATFNTTLCQLSDAVYQHARDNHIPRTDTTRKNWTTITLDGRVTVHLGEHDDHYGPGGLTVTGPGITAQFDPLPAAATLTGLITYLLTLDDTQPETRP
jgi:hypothetical protein